MAPPKRAAGDGVAPPPGWRLRVAAAAAPSASSSNTEPPPSPQKRFMAIALVFLFLKRSKSRSTDDSIPISPSQIGRLVKELGQISHRLGAIARQLQSSIMKPTRAPTLEANNITRPSPNYHNHKRLAQDKNQEGTSSALAEWLATTESEGKEASIRLRFLSEMKPPVYHDDEIKSIWIGIFDGNTMIKSGPFSKVKVEVMALEGSFPYDAEGSWTPEEFHEHRAYGRDGEGNVLAGKGINAQLTNGECHLGSIRFREGSCRARNRMFIVGARVCDGQAICGRVQEAVMNPVVVQDRRNKYNEKSHPPNLNDGVYRLEKIAKKGEYHKRLKEENISTVEHFLKALHKDEEKLAGILQINKKCKDWDKMVKHAQECSLEGKPELKSYHCAERNVILFFNYVHRLVGAKFDGCYIASEMFEPAQQNLVDRLKRHAYDQLDSLTEDHIMKDNIPVPIYMDRDVVAGPSCMPSATQQENSGHRFGMHQGTPATEVLSPHAPTESLRANANNAPGPSSFISDPHSTRNCQVGGIPAVESLTYGVNESPFAIVNNSPGPSFSVHDNLGAQNYQDQGTRLAGQEQHFSAVLDAFSSEVRDMLFEEDGEPAFLQPQADTNNWVEPGLHRGGMQSLVGWPGNGTLEASSSTHIYMVSTPQRLANTGAQGSGEGSMQSQTQPCLPGTTGSSVSAQQALPPHQWPQCQGNMPTNRSF